MIDKLIYKDFIATVHFRSDDNVFYGKIEGINDLVTFESDNVVGLRESFIEAYEDYIDICEKKIRVP